MWEDCGAGYSFPVTSIHVLCGVAGQRVVMWHLTLSDWHKASQAPQYTLAPMEQHFILKALTQYIVCVYHISVVYYGNITYINMANSQQRPIISFVCWDHLSNITTVHSQCRPQCWRSKVNYKAIWPGHWEGGQMIFGGCDVKNMINLKVVVAGQVSTVSRYDLFKSHAGWM